MSKVGIVGVGMVGRAAASAMVSRGSCRELVLVDVRREVAEAVALDLR
jgi:malate/lactate dehydrogenase